jgi:hypothetical protein
MKCSRTVDTDNDMFVETHDTEEYSSWEGLEYEKDGKPGVFLTDMVNEIRDLKDLLKEKDEEIQFLKEDFATLERKINSMSISFHSEGNYY